MDNKILYTAKFTHHDLKFHKVWWKSDKRFESWSGQTDRQTGRFLYTPQTTFAGGGGYDNVSTDIQFLEHENYKFDIFQLIIRPNSETIKGIIT
jgi:hypothetical protein